MQVDVVVVVVETRSWEEVLVLNGMEAGVVEEEVFATIAVHQHS